MPQRIFLAGSGLRQEALCLQLHYSYCIIGRGMIKVSGRYLGASQDLFRLNDGVQETPKFALCMTITVEQTFDSCLPFFYANSLEAICQEAIRL
jgi:hypothetical protein